MKYYKDGIFIGIDNLFVELLKNEMVIKVLYKLFILFLKGINIFYI